MTSSYWKWTQEHVIIEKTFASDMWNLSQKLKALVCHVNTTFWLHGRSVGLDGDAVLIKAAVNARLLWLIYVQFNPYKVIDSINFMPDTPISLSPSLCPSLCPSHLPFLPCVMLLLHNMQFSTLPYTLCCLVFPFTAFLSFLQTTLKKVVLAFSPVILQDKELLGVSCALTISSRVSLY